MKPLDTAAARALQKITSGDRSPWDSGPRSAWTLYIMSLMFRNPETVKLIKDHVTELWDAFEIISKADITIALQNVR
jgi:hypothetical protein